MRTTLKIVLPLIISVAVISLLFAAYQVRTDRRILRNDLSRRAEILGEVAKGDAAFGRFMALAAGTSERLIR